MASWWLGLNRPAVGDFWPRWEVHWISSQVSQQSLTERRFHWSNCITESQKEICNYYFLLFHSDYSVRHWILSLWETGIVMFDGRWLNCHSVTLQPAGELSSPQHPESYSHNLNCEWVIRLPPEDRWDSWYHNVVQSSYQMLAHFQLLYHQIILSSLPFLFK